VDNTGTVGATPLANLNGDNTVCSCSSEGVTFIGSTSGFITIDAWLWDGLAGVSFEAYVKATNYAKVKKGHTHTTPLEEGGGGEKEGEPSHEESESNLSERAAYCDVL
jgi:hypothetical protein